MDTKDKVIHCQRSIIKSMHQRVKERDAKISLLHNMVEAMKEKLLELNVPLSSINFHKKRRDDTPDGEVLMDPLDEADQLYYERDGTPSEEEDKVNAIVRYESGRITPYADEVRRSTVASDFAFSSPERDEHMEQAYLSPYDKHVLESL